MSNEVLIRLKSIKNDSLISTFYTEKPSEYLKMYLICKKEEIPLYAKNMNNEIECFIEDINIFFGGKDNIPCIDIWVEVL